NGDILTNLDYCALVDYHHDHEAMLTVAMHRQQVDIDLGVIESDGSVITGYREKPSLHYEVSMGIYVYEPEALRHLPAGACQFPDFVMRLLDAGERVVAYRSDAEWYDIGTVGEYERAMHAVEVRPDAFGLGLG